MNGGSRKSVSPGRLAAYVALAFAIITGARPLLTALGFAADLGIGDDGRGGPVLIAAAFVALGAVHLVHRLWPPR